MEAAYALRLEADYGNRLVLRQEVQEVLETAHSFLLKVEEVMQRETQP